MLETRRRVLDSARDLFVEQGYATTTISSVARAAKVSPDTVYATFGTKIGLLKALFDATVAGDDESVPVLDRPGPQAMRAETDQRRQIAMLTAGVVDNLERSGPLDAVLAGAAAVDAEAAALREEIQQGQRRRASRTTVRWVAARGPLREGLSEADAATVMWTLASPEVHRLLRGQSGWSRKRYETWLRETLVDSLLPPDPADPSS